MALVTGALSYSGISIQYQSSSLAEFIMVKDGDFSQALRIFTERGCKRLGPGRMAGCRLNDLYYQGFT